MTPTQLKILEQKFSDYADRYILSSSHPEPLILKKEHTMNVCQEIEDLLKSIVNSGKMQLVTDKNAIELNTKLFPLNDEGVLIARTMALFHDLGRFRQFETYRTFLDRDSANHAGLSIAEMDIHDILSICSKREKILIRGAIAVHNAANVPAIDDTDLLFFMKLLRDADKLDIWRVVINNYNSPDPKNQEVVNLGLEDLGGCSSSALDSILKHQYVKINSIKELNDLKLMQISWVFDLNFPQSVQKVAERGYIDQLASTLSVDKDHPGINEALEAVYDHIKMML